MRIATLICGDFRSCPRAIEHIFKYVESLGAVDYYFSTWDTTRDHWWPVELSAGTQRPVTSTDITNLFSNRNLVAHRQVDQTQIPSFDSTYYYQGYLAKIANILKRRHELDFNFVYDLVIEIRPDLYINGSIDTNCANFEIVNGPVWFNNDIAQAADMTYYSNSFTNDVLGNRYFYSKYLTARKFDPYVMNHTHWILYDFLTHRKLTIKNGKGWHIPVRPNFPNNFQDYSEEQLKQLDQEWVHWQWTAKNN